MNGSSHNTRILDSLGSLSLSLRLAQRPVRRLSLTFGGRQGAARAKDYREERK